MNLLRFFFPPRQSAPVARERLQILLTHERTAGNQSDLVAILREDVLAVIAKHVTVDPDKVEVKLDRLKAVSILEIDIEIPNNAPARSAEPRKRTRKPSVRRSLSASSA